MTIIILKNFAATYQLVCPIIYTAVWVTPDTLIGLLDPEVTACTVACQFVVLTFLQMWCKDRMPLGVCLTNKITGVLRYRLLLQPVCSVTVCIPL